MTWHTKGARAVLAAAIGMAMGTMIALTMPAAAQPDPPAAAPAPADKLDRKDEVLERAIRYLQTGK